MSTANAQQRIKPEHYQLFREWSGADFPKPSTKKIRFFQKIGFLNPKKNPIFSKNRIYKP
jgi:hypothetical protein